MSRVTRLQNRLYDRMRHPEAFQAASRAGAGAAAATGFEHLAGHRYALLVTFRRSGEGVPTPVWFGLDGGRAYVGTEADTAKVRRLRRDPRVRVGPCDSRGKPDGPLAEGTARIIPADDSEAARHAERAIQANYGAGRRIYEATFMRGNAAVYLELTAV